jgi:5-methylcytosine-specific restriction enzyme subunit McrC
MVQVEIPVRNIFYLLLYAWDEFRNGSPQDFGVDDSPDLPNLLAKVLNDGVHRLLRRGLDRGYIGTTEETRSPRGKLRLDLMTKQQSMLRGFAICDVDELTPDVLHNQILRASIASLANCADVDKAQRRELQATLRHMSGVSVIKLTASLFHRVQLSRNISQYGFLMRLCELVFDKSLPDEKGTGSRFLNILEDEITMSRVFEKFLKNFYKSELPAFKVEAPKIVWEATAINQEDLSYLPEMRTDITLCSSTQAIIVDAKYHKDTLTNKYRSDDVSKKSVKSQDLYQLSTYLAHAPHQKFMKREPESKLSGMLIYPSIGRQIRLNFEILGVPVKVATVDLSAEWKEIDLELKELINPTNNIDVTIY